MGVRKGHRSQLFINPDKKIAYSVMINSSGTSPTKYIKGIHEILSKVNTLKGTEINKFKELTGSYNTQPWTGRNLCPVLGRPHCVSFFTIRRTLFI